MGGSMEDASDSSSDESGEEIKDEK